MCPELYQRILSKEIKEADQKRALMVIVSKVFEEKMKDPDVRFDLLTFKYIKLSTPIITQPSSPTKSP